MIATKAFAAQDAVTPLGPFTLDRRDVGAHDVQIEILYCGVCHSDIHQVRNEWGGSIYPMVPGHEIVGRIVAVGAEVKKFKAGDLAGIGCFVDSCRHCANCQAGEEQYCDNGMTGTYNALERETKKPTYGGYSTQIVVDENYTLKVSPSLPLERVAPLLCAGITTYSPLRYAKVGKGHKVGVLGLGGLGHMAVKFAVAFGAEVTMLSHSPSKEKDAKSLGAHHFALTSDAAKMKSLANSFDFILNTVSAQHEYGPYLSLLRTNGTMIVVGVPEVGGIKETQEMLDYCSEHNIASDVEVIKIQDINTAYERMLKGDVHYRFVIDTASL
jgi:uncharacterized zinc-type alcohol dehydrogenase-like protein